MDLSYDNDNIYQDDAGYYDEDNEYDGEDSDEECEKEDDDDDDINEVESVAASDFSAVDVRASQMNFRSSIANAQGITGGRKAVAKRWRSLYKKHLHIPSNHLEYLVLDHHSSALGDTAHTDTLNSTAITTATNNSSILSTTNQSKLIEETIDYDFKINVTVNKIKTLKFSLPYCFYISRITNIPVPSEVLAKFTNPKLSYRIQLSWFHTNTRKFFGRTFKSPFLSQGDIQRVETTSVVTKDNVYFELPVFFHTPIVDESVVLVADIVVGVWERKALVREFSLGWTILRIFRHLDYGKNLEQFPQLRSFVDKKGRIKMEKEDDSFIRSTPFFTGTPRNLPFLNEPIENSLVPRLGCRVYCSLTRHSPLKKALHLMRPNDLVCEYDAVPGLVQLSSLSGGEKTTSLIRPELNLTTVIELSQLRIAFPAGFESRLLQRLEDNRKKEQGQMYDIDRQCSIDKRFMVVGAHNGCTFLKPPIEAAMLPASITSEGDLSPLTFDGSLVFPNYVRHALCALVLELHFVVNIPYPVEMKPKKRGIIRRLAGNKGSEGQKDNNASKQNIVVVGAYVHFPMAETSGNQSVFCPMMTGPMRSFSNRLMYALPTISESVGEIKMPTIDLSFKVSDLEHLDHRPKTKPVKPKVQPIESTPPPPVPEPQPVLSKPKHIIPKESPKAPPRVIPKATFDTIQDEFGNPVTETSKRQMQSFEILPIHEIHVQFMYFESVLSKTDEQSPQQQQMPKSLSLSFQFFNSALIPASHKLFLVNNEVPSTVYLLSQSKEAQNPGLHLTFPVNSMQMTTEEQRDFELYLQSRKLFIDVFENDSNTKYGTICVQLEDLMREDTQCSTQFTREYAIKEPLEKSCDVSVQDRSRNNSKGLLHLRLTNVGRRTTSSRKELQIDKDAFEGGVQQTRVSHVPRLEEGNAGLMTKLESITKFDKHSMEERLKTIDSFRENQRISIIRQHIEKQITKRKLIYSTLAKTYSLQLKVNNPTQVQMSYRLHIDAPGHNEDLSIVCDQREMETLGVRRESLRQVLSLGNNMYEIAVAPQQTAMIPFRYQTLNAKVHDHPEDFKVAVTTLTDNALVKILKLRVVHRSHIVHRFFHFGCKVNEEFVATLPYHLARYDDAPSKSASSGHNCKIYVSSTHDSECSVQEMESRGTCIRIVCRPQTLETCLTFNVALFGDEFLYDLRDIWCVKVRWHSPLG